MGLMRMDTMRYDTLYSIQIYSEKKQQTELTQLKGWETQDV